MMDSKDKFYIERPKKGMYMVEMFDDSWELDHANDLDNDHIVAMWTRKHEIKIPYIYKGKRLRYNPDFWVELINGTIELHEVKSSRDIDSPKEQEKFRVARIWCEEHSKVNKQSITFKIITRY